MRSSVAVSLVALLVTCACPAFGAVSTAFRMTDLDLRDPHVFISFLGCRDYTDTPLAGLSMNGDLQRSIQTDSDSSGFLDMSLLLIFDPLNTPGPGGPMRYVESSCLSPMASTVCGPAPFETLVQMYATNSASGTCLGVLPGTTSHLYTPSITTTTGPCFASDEHVLTLNLGGIPVTLRSARVSATYSASPGNLVNGLIRGFIPQADADNTIIPASYPLVGGSPFSQLLAGGDPPGVNNQNCASWSDKDLGPDGITQGWWMYLNFTAKSVPYTGPQLDVAPVANRAMSLTASPSPFRSSVTLECWLTHEGQARVAVFDLFGREITELERGHLAAGLHRVTWDGTGGDHQAAPPGLYVLRLTSAGQSVTRPVMRLN